MTIPQLRRLFTRYVRDTEPPDMSDAAGGELAFDENGDRTWDFADTLFGDGDKAVLTLRRNRIVDDGDRDRAEQWVKDFAKFAGVKLLRVCTAVVRDNDADYDVSVEARFDVDEHAGNPDMMTLDEAIAHAPNPQSPIPNPQSPIPTIYYN